MTLYPKQYELPLYTKYQIGHCGPTIEGELH